MNYFPRYVNNTIYCIRCGEKADPIDGSFNFQSLIQQLYSRATMVTYSNEI